MPILVQKFGGTSVADSNKILAAARKAILARKEGYQVVVVVSAMGKNTDKLVSLARRIHESPPAREMDMLLSTGEQVSVALMAMAIDSLGQEAISMTGAQIGIVTDSTHTKARIQSIATDRIHRALDAGKIVIAAGFQGVDRGFNITTLGRGGSDTTAVALAAALGAEACEIYTDVDGIYTTDPRLLPEARRVRQISYDEMLELASAGAGVMHNRSIEFAKRFSVPVHVRGSFTDNPGTIITAEPESASQPVCGVAVVRHEARVSVLGVPDRPGAAMTLFSKVAARNIAMDMIVQNVGDGGLANISFTVFREDLPAVLTAVEQAVEELDAQTFNYDDDVSVISVVGLGMATQPGVANRMFRALAESEINILMITTSPIKISVLVARESVAAALAALHAAFSLETEPPEESVPGPVGRAPTNGRSAAAMIARLQGMEDLIIEGITLDESEARVTILGVPDTPGLAAEVFEEIGAGGIVVDMIVQGFSGHERADLSFTLPKEDYGRGLDLTARLAERFHCPEPLGCSQVALLSVSGIGMRSHTEVASRMFQSLTAQDINVEMINTSEMCVTAVVDGHQGVKALDALRREFGDVMV
ncbi:MAG: aspartate kinase [Pirellulales bacterium]|nr:aspartate kinase [Pirellulales bacterium]